MPHGPAVPRFATKSLFSLKAKRTSACQEVLAGILGWQTIVSSFEFYASLFVGDDDDVDGDATFEVFLLVAGMSTLVYGVVFNVPFIVAPSVLYAAREPGIDIGGHLAAQAAANLAAAFAFSLALKTSFVSYMPTALRLGAGCGLAMLVSVLGMRNIGLLIADSFTLQTPTWETIVGLLIITGACGNVSKDAKTKKWKSVVLIPFVLTLMTYAVTDRTKFRGYFSGSSVPLSNWGSGSFGMVDFHQLWVPSRQLWFYMVRLFLSISINVSSILLVLIDAVCLEEVHTKVKSSAEVDFSNDISGTKKFRSMACAIPLMSFVGNLMGVTTQAAFVQTMMPVFAGGKTGLSSVVTGGLLIFSTLLRPVLPLIVPPHVSGALTVVISLRFFTVVKMVDVQRPINVLMFGMSILLIPFSFEFVDALCITTMLGFACQTLDTIVALLGSRRGGNKVVVSLAAGDTYKLDGDGREATTAKTLLYENSNPTPQKGLRRSYGTASFSARRRTAHKICAEPVSPLGDTSPGLAAPGESAALGETIPRPGPPISPVISSMRSLFPSGRASSSRRGPSGGLNAFQSSVRSHLGPKDKSRPAGTVTVHWTLALVASCELALTAIDHALRADSES